MDTPSRLKDLAVSESGFVFDPYTGATFSANDSGLVVLDGLRRGLSREAIRNSLGERFEIGEADLSRDLDEFVHVLREHGLLPKDYVLA